MDWLTFIRELGLPSVIALGLLYIIKLLIEGRTADRLAIAKADGDKAAADKVAAEAWAKMTDGLLGSLREFQKQLTAIDARSDDQHKANVEVLTTLSDKLRQMTIYVPGDHRHIREDIQGLRSVATVEFGRLETLHDEVSGVATGQDEILDQLAAIIDSLTAVRGRVDEVGRNVDTLRTDVDEVSTRTDLAVQSAVQKARDEIATAIVEVGKLIPVITAPPPAATSVILTTTEAQHAEVAAAAATIERANAVLARRTGTMPVIKVEPEGGSDGKE